MKKYWYNFKFWFDGMFNPHVVGYKMEPVVQFIKKAYQICTPWFGPKRMLMKEAQGNYGKLLNSGLSFVYQRTRDGKTVYYLLTTYFGYIKFYRKEFVDKKTKKNINTFMHLVIPGLCGEDNTDTITEKKVCLYKGWGLTQKQCLNALMTIRKLSKNLNWESGICDEYASYRWAETALNYLKGKKVYFMYDKMTKEEAEKEFREQIYLIQRDIQNRDKYTMDIQNLMFKVLEKPSDMRNKELVNGLKELLKKFEKAGYKKFWTRYYS